MALDLLLLLYIFSFGVPGSLDNLGLFIRASWHHISGGIDNSILLSGLTSKAVQIVQYLPPEGCKSLPFLKTSV